MSRLTLSIWTLAVLGIAGCATRYDPAPATPVTTTSGAPVTSSTSAAAPAGGPRAGYGIIESISLVNPPASAAAGGTQPPAASGPYRITARMDDGSVRTVVGNNR